MRSKFVDWLIALQTRHPLWVIAAMLLSVVPTGYAASKLTLRTSFTELLPGSKPSVIEMHRDDARLPGSSTLAVVAQGHDTRALEKFVDAAVPKILALGPDLVGGIDDGPRRMQAFFEKNEGLYADLADLKELRDEVTDSYDAEIARATGMDLGLDDEDAPKKLSVDDIIDKLKKKEDSARKSAPGRDGYYVSRDGKLATFLIRTPFGTGDQRAFELVRKVQAIIDGLNPRRWDPTMHFGYTGDLVTSAEQQQAITRDLLNVGIWGIGLILTVVFLFFLQLRTLFAMGLTIGVGCVWAFGVAKYSVGYLNTATGFLASIIAGNGINFGIIYMARYAEARRDEGRGVDEAVAVAHRGTWVATLSAAGAAGVAYGSLSITDFRGFKDFGVIGGSGMLLCWVATYLLLPAILVATERVAPMFRQGRNGLTSRFSALYGRPFAWLARRFNRPVAALALLSGVASLALTVRYLAHDPLEYDFRNIRNEDTAATPARLLGDKVDEIVGRQGQDGRAILIDRLDQLEPLVAELNRRNAAAPAGKKPFSKVVTIDSLLPDHQQEKLALLAEIRDRVTRARRRKFISDADWARLEPHMPESLGPIGIRDLPDDLARPFSERDGTRGRILYIVPSEHVSVYDAHYLMRWADAFREVRLPNGDVIHGSGNPVIFSDMLIAIREDAPKAIGLSFLGTLVVILVSFRARKPGWFALATLVLGLSWLFAFCALDGIKLNFLNFVGLPISIGVGADYALNVMSRREKESGGSIERVIVETGGAVILCSLTTTLGYLALMLSINKAVRSFGLVAATGEIAAVTAAVLVLPSVLMLARKESVG